MTKNKEGENQYILHKLLRAGDIKGFEEEIIKNENNTYNPYGSSVDINDMDNLGLSPMHLSIMLCNLEALKICINHDANKTLHCERMPPLHLLCHSLSISKEYDSTFAKEAFSLLYTDNGINFYVDKLGRTVYHLAAAYGLVDILELCFEKEPESVNIEDNEGNNPLHYAAKFDQVESGQYLLSISSDLILKTNKYLQSPLHMALYNDSTTVYTLLMKNKVPSPPLHEKDIYGHSPVEIWKEIIDKKRQNGGREFPHTQSHLGIFVSNGNYDHVTCKEPICNQAELPPPENPDRLRVLLEYSHGGSLLHEYIRTHSTIEFEEQEIDIPSLLRVHDINYIMKVMKLSKSLTNTPSTLTTPLDGDTPISAGTFSAGRKACKCICTAIDTLMKEDSNCHNAFVCVRPPGHHVGVSGAVDNENVKGVSNGFCLFNNVCVAAAYARNMYPSLTRIAILDIDIHHGNGTQEIVEALVPTLHAQTLSLFNSTLTSSTYVYKPWKDINDGSNTFFASVQGYGPLEGNTRFYPGSGKTEDVHINTDNVQFGSSMQFSTPTIINVGIPKIKHSNGYPWREAWREHVFPRLLDFKPDLIFVSAGFDGHSRDSLNRGYGALNEEDYSYIIREIIKIANTVCPAHVISVLEGGYSIEGAGAGPLAQSVQSYVETMTQCFYEECNPMDWKIQSEFEKKEYDALFTKKQLSSSSMPTQITVNNTSLNVSKYVEAKNEVKNEDDILKQVLNQEEEESEPECIYSEEEEEEEEEERMKHDEEDEEEDEEEDNNNIDIDIDKENIHKVTEQFGLSSSSFKSDTIINKEEDDDDDDDDDEDDDMNIEEDEEEEEEEELPEVEEGEADKLYNPLIETENHTVISEEQRIQEQQNINSIAGRAMRKRKVIDYVALDEQLKKEEEEMKRKRLQKQEE
ncbi:hypothetical protein WA158_004485 [Blastocystis sp. Blastoise]